MKSVITLDRPHAKGARAFRDQHELPPYQQLLRDTVEWLNPGPGERWLDLGCGNGQLSRALWVKSGGRVEAIIGVDVEEASEKAFAALRATLNPTPTPMCLRFVARDFAKGFADWPGDQFAGIVSALALPYAESSDVNGVWTETAYDRVLTEVHRLLRPGGAFVFSVNVPEPSWSRIAWHSVSASFRTARPLRSLKSAWRMWSYARWLTQESRHGRFHYLPIEAVIEKLTAARFVRIEHRISYAGQAYVVRCWK
jgi:SAM-dependent methyltransferase